MVYAYGIPYVDWSMPKVYRMLNGLCLWCTVCRLVYAYGIPYADWSMPMAYRMLIGLCLYSVCNCTCSNIACVTARVMYQYIIYSWNERETGAIHKRLHDVFIVECISLCTSI